MSDDRDPRMERFDTELRAWVERPPALTPAAAARQIAARLEGRPAPATRFHPGWAWTAAGLAAAVAIAGLMRVGGVPGAGLPSAPASRSTPLTSLPPGAGALAEEQVLIWLDPETPLYMNFAPPAGERNPGGGS
jgi:hypothetical protein